MKLTLSSCVCSLKETTLFASVNRQNSRTLLGVGGLGIKRSFRFASKYSGQQSLEMKRMSLEGSSKRTGRTGKLSEEESSAQKNMKIDFLWRKWSLTKLGLSRFQTCSQNSARNRPTRGKVSFTVMSYNVLADYLMKLHLELYQNARLRDWNVRWSGILEQISHYGPDVLCLQEVQDDHFQSHYVPDLTKLGYSGMFKQRTGDKRDGCAIFYKNRKFDVLEESSVEFFQPNIDVLNRDNVALLVKLKPLDAPDSSQFVVATTHLLYNPRRIDVRLAQLALLFAELDRFARKVQGNTSSHKHSDAYLPCVVTGDFNLNPDCPIYRDFILKGSLSLNKLQRGDSLIPPELGITDTCQHADVLTAKESSVALPYTSRRLQGDTRQIVFAQEGSFRTKPGDAEKPTGKRDKYAVPDHCAHMFGNGKLRHQFGFKSTYWYAGNDVSSLQHNGYAVVDYLLYTSKFSTLFNRLVEGKLKLISRLDLPSSRQCTELGGFPNQDCPSDHVFLMANFLLMP